MGTTPAEVACGCGGFQTRHRLSAGLLHDHIHTSSNGERLLVSSFVGTSSAATGAEAATRLSLAENFAKSLVAVSGIRALIGMSTLPDADAMSRFARHGAGIFCACGKAFRLQAQVRAAIMNAGATLT